METLYTFNYYCDIVHNYYNEIGTYVESVCMDTKVMSQACSHAIFH